MSVLVLNPRPPLDLMNRSFRRLGDDNDDDEYPYRVIAVFTAGKELYVCGVNGLGRTIRLEINELDLSPTG